MQCMFVPALAAGALLDLERRRAEVSGVGKQLHAHARTRSPETAVDAQMGFYRRLSRVGKR
jgi:hypothetical protein